MDIGEIRDKLLGKGMKVTPQRMAILEAISTLNNHPTAENIIDYIRKNNPNIATATVYKVLDALIENGLINKVKTEKDIMRYDAHLEKHHHLYSTDSDRIEDYADDELSEILEKHFEKKGIPGFKIEDIKLQIIGKFTDKSSTK
jgi:Fur family transcriptional regulator, peroxide stress response regulator